MRANIKYWLAPGLREVELTAADYLAQRFSHHWHTGFAIGVVTRNAQGFHADGREWTIGVGDLITLNPGQIHNGYSLTALGWSSRMAYIPEQVFSEIACTGCIRPMRFGQAVVHAPNLAQKFLSWHIHAEEARDLRDEFETEELFEVLLALMEQHGGDEQFSVASARKKRIEGYVHSLATQGLASVSSLNEELHLTRFGSWRCVKKEFGLAPKPLLSHIRLMTAKQQLVQGLPVVEVSHNCGYHDQSHFSRQFAAAYGFTPAQFQRTQLLPT